MERNFFMQLAVLTAFILLFSCHGQFYYGYFSSRNRDIKSLGPNPLRYFSPSKREGLMPGWYHNKREFWKNRKKRFYTTEEAIENGGIMPNMPDVMGTEYGAPDGFDGGLFQSDPTYGMDQSTFPPAMPQETPYPQAAGVQSYPESDPAIQSDYPTLTPYLTGAVLQQYDQQAPSAPEATMLSPETAQPQTQTQYQPATQYQSQSQIQPQQVQPRLQPQVHPQTQAQIQVRPQTQLQTQSRYQPQSPIHPQSQIRPVSQLQPQAIQTRPQTLPRPALAKYPNLQRPKPMLLPPLPSPRLAPVPSTSVQVKTKFKYGKSSRICAPGPPLKQNPRFKNCLVIGDSIAIGYLRTVKLLLRDMCQVQHAPFARGSGAVDSKHGVSCLSMLLKTTSMEPTHYDAIIFNFGMHDINYSKRFPEEHVSFKNYKKNLKILKEAFLTTGAKVAFALTTPHVSSKNRNERIKRYNKAAVSVMEAGHRIPVINMYDVIVNRCGEPANDKYCSIMKGRGDVHYNEEGCRLLGVRVAATFATMLNQSKAKKHAAVRPRPRFIGQQYFERYITTNAVTCPDALTRCPIGTTCCESFLSLTGYGCCMMADGVSCQDNWHCCPHGSMCSPTCNVRECHCMTVVESSKGKKIKKKIKAKVKPQAKSLKKKLKSSSHPLVRVLKKWHHRKNISHKVKTGKTPRPELTKMLKGHHFMKDNTTNHLIIPDNNTAELGHLIQHHHKSSYKELKNYLQGNDLHHHEHHLEISADGEKIEASASGGSTSASAEDNFSASSSGEGLQSYDNHQQEQQRQYHHHNHDQISHEEDQALENEVTSSTGIISGHNDAKRTHNDTKIYDFSGEKDVLLYNNHYDEPLGSGEEYISGSEKSDSEDEFDDDVIQGKTKSKIRDFISPVNPFEGASISNISKIGNKLKAYTVYYAPMKTNYSNGVMSHNASSFVYSGDRPTFAHLLDSTNNDSAYTSSEVRENHEMGNQYHGGTMITGSKFPERHGIDRQVEESADLRGGDNDEMLSSEFRDSDGSVDRDFDLMTSASTNDAKDQISAVSQEDQRVHKDDNGFKGSTMQSTNHPYNPLNVIPTSKESWVNGESRNGLKDDSHDIEISQDDDDSSFTSANSQSSQHATGQIDNDLRSELVQLDELVEEGPSGRGEYKSSGMVENPRTADDNQYSKFIHQDSANDRKKDKMNDNRPLLSTEIVSNPNDNKNVEFRHSKKLVESQLGKAEKKEAVKSYKNRRRKSKVAKNLLKTEFNPLNQTKLRKKPHRVSKNHSTNEPVNVSHIQHIANIDTKGQSFYNNDNKLLDSLQQKRNNLKVNQSKIPWINNSSNTFSVKGDERIKGHQSSNHRSLDHSEAPRLYDGVSKTQKQNQRIANTSILDFNKQQSRTQNSSKRFSMYNKNNFSNVNKHFSISSSNITNMGHKFGLGNSFNAVENPSFESDDSDLNTFSADKDDITNERVDSDESSSSAGEDSMLEEYLNF